MPTIVVLANDRNGHHPEASIRAVEAAGASVRVILPSAAPEDGATLADASGLLVPDPDPLHPSAGGYARLLHEAVNADMPVLLTGGGMHLLNTCFGGAAPSDVTDHEPGDEDVTLRHQIYLSPGSKVAAIIGSAGMFRVNSRHTLGIREPQRAERLMTIAYQLDDGVIEGLESKEHSWVIGVQFLPERGDEVPASFNNLFLGLVERAEDFSGHNDTRSTAR